MDDGSSVLSVRRLSKSYSGVPALKDVSLTLRRGTVHCLVGGNGSGKSTLAKVLAGVANTEVSGHIAMGAEAIEAQNLTPPRSRQLGLSFVHQDAGIFGDLSVAENLAVVDGYPTGFAGRVDWARLRHRCRAVLGDFGLHEIDPDTPAGFLRPATQMVLAIARALASAGRGDGTPGVLVLDEPTAALPNREAEFLLAELRRLASDGHSIMLITHHLSEVLEVADDVTVLRDGRLVATHGIDDLDLARLVELIVGTAAEAWDRSPVQRGLVDQPAALAVENLGGGAVKDLSFSVGPGEVLGIAGMLGSGRSQVLRLISGSQPRSGSVRVGGELLAPSSVAAAVDAGVVYVPEDRDQLAAFSDLTVQENLVAASLEHHTKRWYLSRRSERDAALGLIDLFGVKANGPAQSMSTLSGGNRQKVVVARWLCRTPAVVLADEPTQGVDVGARREIHNLIEDAVEGGAAAVVVSSDFDELCLLCDRVLVIRDGQQVTVIDRRELSEARLVDLSYSQLEQP